MVSATSIHKTLDKPITTVEVTEDIKYTDNHESTTEILETITEKESEEDINDIIDKFNIGSQKNSDDVLKTKGLYYNKICSICEKYNIDPV